MAWRYRARWQVEGIFNYVPKVLICVLTMGRWRWYVIGAYIPPNDAPTVSSMEQELGQAAKGVEFILLVDLNVRLVELRDAREEELVTVVADCGLEYITDHFIPRRSYRGDRRWTWRMRRDDQQVTGRR